MEEELNPEEFYAKFTHIAAGFVADELPPLLIKQFLDHIKADPFGNKKEEKPVPPVAQAVEKKAVIQQAQNTTNEPKSGLQPLPIQTIDKKRAMPESINKAVEEAVGKAKKSAGVKAGKGQN